MLNEKPTVHNFMSTNVETISAEKTLQDAMNLMQIRKIRHLPVVTANSQVVGIISDRDIKAALSMDGVDPAKSLVHYFSKDVVYTVSPDMPLDKVAEAMAQSHYGSAVVMKDSKLVGILTLVDICKALSYVIRLQFPS
jgi:acetoin utilization protein AcuB